MICFSIGLDKTSFFGWTQIYFSHLGVPFIFFLAKERKNSQDEEARLLQMNYLVLYVSVKQ